MDQNSLFRFSIDNAMEIILIFDDSGAILYANHSADHALEYYEELHSSHIFDIFPGEFQMQNGTISYTCTMDGTSQTLMAYRKNRTCFLSYLTDTESIDDPIEICVFGLLNSITELIC